MQDEATRRKWREYKRKWREANPERNRELDSRAYHRNRETINGKRKEVRKLFAEWRQSLKTPEAAKHG
ncbi:hypothetical protein NKH14_26790 [Mesorhizobium sp. M1380]|uniref:hypothetical protein n=1 Tax=Mesorhizobium sp. M1380 TaxID=2957093 RepID=UPI0033362847